MSNGLDDRISEMEAEKFRHDFPTRADYVAFMRRHGFPVLNEIKPVQQAAASDGTPTSRFAEDFDAVFGKPKT